MQDLDGFKKNGDVELKNTAYPRLRRLLHTSPGEPAYAPNIGIDATSWIKSETAFTPDAFRSWLSAELAERLFSVEKIEIKQGDSLAAMVEITLYGGSDAVQ